jgi:hypothetical protein
MWGEESQILGFMSEAVFLEGTGNTKQELVTSEAPDS